MYPTAYPVLPLNLKPAPSTATVKFEKDDGESSGSSLSANDNGSSSSTKDYSGLRVLILISFFAIFSVTVIASCVITTRWCWRRWSGYSQIDIYGDSNIELGIVRDGFLELDDESTYLNN